MKKDDTLWKGLLEDLFEEFMLFIFKDEAAIFDFGKGFEFLNTELAQICPIDENAEHPKHVDKLVKVFTKEGQEEWVLVHVEVQGYDDAGFAQRMFKYFYRILDKYSKRLTCIAIFTGNAKKASQVYQYNFLGTKANFEYNIYKIAEQDSNELEASNNVFALVSLAVLNTLQKGQSGEDELLKLQLGIAKALLSKNIPKKKITTVLYFLRNYVHFDNPENVSRFDSEIILLTNGNTSVMGLEELLNERAEKRGAKRGREEEQQSFIKSLLENTDFDTAKIAMLVGVSQEYVETVKARLVN